MGRKSDSFFLPSAAALEATTMFTRYETAAFCPGQCTDSFFSLCTPPLLGFFQGPLLARLL